MPVKQSVAVTLALLVPVHSQKFVVRMLEHQVVAQVLVVTELVHPVLLVHLDSFTVLHRTVVVLQTTVV